MFLRALNICDPEFLDDELKYIFEVGYKNHFKKHDIERCLSLAKGTFYSVNNHSLSLNNIMCIPYHPSLENIKFPLKLLNLHLTFSFPYTIGKTLIRNSPTTREGAVYKIECGCGKFYIGQTGKTLDLRVSQHKYNVRIDDRKSAITNHTRTCHFPIKWSYAKELYKNSNFIERNLIETAIIQHTKNFNMNTSNGLYNLDNIFLHIFNKQYKPGDKL